MTDINPNPGSAQWPAEFQGSRLTGRFIDHLGNPIKGSVTVRPSSAALLAAESKTVIIPVTKTIPLDETGAFDVTVPATDDPDINPQGWTYTVTESFPGGRSYSITAPMNATQDLSLIAPVPSSAGTAIVVGPAGPQGPEGPAGPAGSGVPTGGTAGEVLAKNSSTDGDAGWKALTPADVGAAPAGDYATNTALTNGLAGKQPTGDYATNTALTNGLAAKQPTGDYATHADLTSGLAGKADASSVGAKVLTLAGGVAVPSGTPAGTLIVRY